MARSRPLTFYAAAGISASFAAAADPFSFLTFMIWLELVKLHDD